MVLDMETKEVRKICSRCKKTFDFWDTEQGFGIHKMIGYGSKYDEEELDLNLCCDCMDWLIDECKIFAKVP